MVFGLIVDLIWMHIRNGLVTPEINFKAMDSIFNNQSLFVCTSYIPSRCLVVTVGSIVLFGEVFFSGASGNNALHTQFLILLPGCIILTKESIDKWFEFKF